MRGVEWIVDAMGRHVEDSVLQRRAVGALNNLAWNAENMERIGLCERTVVEAVVDAMGRHVEDALLQRGAVIALGNLAVIVRSKERIGLCAAWSGL